MNFLNKMERRFGRYALTNLSLYIVLTYAAGYLLYMITPQVLTYMTLEPAMILRGQVWRIVSWLLIPPSTQNIFFILIIKKHICAGKTSRLYFRDIHMKSFSIATSNIITTDNSFCVSTISFMNGTHILSSI